MSLQPVLLCHARLAYMAQCFGKSSHCVMSFAFLFDWFPLMRLYVFNIDCTLCTVVVLTPWYGVGIHLMNCCSLAFLNLLTFQHTQCLYREMTFMCSEEDNHCQDHHFQPLAQSLSPFQLTCVSLRPCVLHSSII